MNVQPDLATVDHAAARAEGGAWPRARLASCLLSVALGVVLVAAAVLRLTGINWDQFQHVHPDERFIVWVADTISWPGSLAAALDPARSTVDPFRWPAGAGDLAGQARNYPYGHFPLYLLVLVAQLAAAAGRWLAGLTLSPALHSLAIVASRLAGYDDLALVGRAISALCDLGVVCLVYALARRAYGRTALAGRMAGLLAAAAYAFAVLPIQLSHFYAVDMVLTLCVVACVALAARWAEGGGQAAWLGAGALAGLAVGSKFSAVLLAVPLVVAALCRWYAMAEGHAGRAADAGVLATPSAGGGEALPARTRFVLARLAAAGGMALLAFVVTNPFAIIEFRAYAGQILNQNAMVSGSMDAPYTRQFIGSLPYWYFIQQISQWGLGWPLGLLAWAGFAGAAVAAWRGRAAPAQVVMLAWALPYFAATGIFFAKFPRYMAPLLPFLLVFAAGGCLTAYRRLAARWPRGARLGAVAGTLLVATFTVGWAVAFTGVYRQEHPWLQASRWIYSHIPDGKLVLTEHWDDGLPLAMDELRGAPPPRDYQHAQLPLYDPDTLAKAGALAQQLSRGDYLVIASNRLYRPIERLTGRYPMSSQYYRQLFSGQLGYQRVAEFAVYPRLGGLTIRDDNADESFTVYDHPHVFIFANTGHISEATLRARLARYLPSGGGQALRTGEAVGAPAGVTRVRLEIGPGVAFRDTQGPDGRRAPGLALDAPVAHAAAPAPTPAPAPLRLAQPVDTLPVVADFRWNALASDSAPLSVLLWWLALGLFGWLAWPLLYPLLGGLADRGYGLGRIAGWLLVGWVHWMGVSLGLWQNRAPIIALLLALLAGGGAAAAYRQRAALRAFWRAQRRLLLAEEALFGVLFLVFVSIRLLDPDLWQPWNGGEKFMEFAFLNAILRSPHFPPYDPYFAGGIINYYYFGLYLVSLPIKLTGIFPEVAFNLAIPGLYALTATAVFSIVYTLAGALPWRTHAAAVAAAESAVNGAEGVAGPAAGVAVLPGNAGPLPPAGTGMVLAAAAKAAPRRAGAPFLPALLAVFLALVMGNLDGFWQVVRNVAGLAGNHFTASWAGLALRFITGVGGLLRGASWPAYDFWAPSRVIPFTINEFPFWTFLFGDMHPHLIAMPLGLLVVGLALNWMAVGGRREPGSAGFAADIARLLALVIALGALGATNTWDLPVYALLVAGAFWLAAWRRHDTPGLAAALLLALCVTALAVSAYWPFYAHYHVEVGGAGDFFLARFLAPVRSASPTGDWLRVWGFFLFLAYSVTLRRALKGFDASDTASVVAAAAALVIALGLAILRRPTAAIAALPAVLALATFVRRRIPITDAFANLLLLLGLGIVAGTELVYLRDFLEGGDWYRMNTVFKFSMPAWLFLAMAGGLMLPQLWRGLAHPAPEASVYAEDRPLAGNGPAPGVDEAASDGAAREPGAAMGRPDDLAVSGTAAPDGEPETAPATGVAATWSGQAGDPEPPGGAAAERTEDIALYVTDDLTQEASAPAGEPGRAIPPEGAAAGGRGLGMIWRAAAVLLLVAGLFFPIFGTAARVSDRFPGLRPPHNTLDGTAFMTVGRYTWPDQQHTIDLAYDYLAIHWLLDHVSGTPVIAEAPAGEYQVNGVSVGYDYYRAGGLRVASLTGFPTFVGQHQYEQRPGADVAERTALGQEFFQTTDVERTRNLAGDLHVGYIYVGQLERMLFGEDMVRKFHDMVAAGDLSVVYQNPQVTIYQVRRGEQ